MLMMMMMLVMRQRRGILGRQHVSNLLIWQMTDAKEKR
jgi:hypothetical protein